jgi:hypothetical protein
MNAAAWPLAEPPPDVELVGERFLIGQPLSEFLAEDDGPVRWFGPMPEGSLTAGLGKPESFKTFGVIQLGLAGAAGSSWLGMELGEPRPFVYLAAEKSRATVRDRFARMTPAFDLVAPVRIIHRAGVTFGDRASWARVREAVQDLGRRSFVVADTIASLAGPGFDENSGKDMAVVLAALRQLTDLGATVMACHHPNKHGEGNGGVRMRGHSSLWGEVDATLEFKRPDREDNTGTIVAEPKDGDISFLRFTWSRETFLMDLGNVVRILTARTLAEVVEALDAGEGVTSERIGSHFATHKRSSVMAKLAEAVSLGLVRKAGNSTATRYFAGRSPDTRPSGGTPE